MAGIAEDHVMQMKKRFALILLGLGGTFFFPFVQKQLTEALGR